EVGELVEQFVELRHRRGLDREALSAEAQHLLVGCAQRLARGGRELLQRPVDSRDVVDVPESRNREIERPRYACRHVVVSCIFSAKHPPEKSNTTRSTTAILLLVQRSCRTTR